MTTTPPPLWLADEMWLVAHDDQDGGPRLHASALGLGLAAALLGELVVFGHLDVQDGQVYVIDPRPPGNALSYEVFDQVRAEPQHPVPNWLAYLAQDAAGRVAQRLVRNGYLQSNQSRGLWRTTQTLLPVDPGTAAWPVARLHGALSRQQPMNQNDTLLAGLVAAVGLAGHILWRCEPQYLRHQLSRLGAAMRELVALTEAAVGDATLTRHRS